MQVAGGLPARSPAGYMPPMPDRIALPLIALTAAGLIALAMVWPQGQGAVSPPPFGHPVAPVSDVQIPTALGVPAKPEPKPPVRP